MVVEKNIMEFCRKIIKGRLGGKMELQKLTIGDNKLYLDGVEIKNVKDFILKSSVREVTELNVTIYVTTSQDSFE